jgi:opacity protein-like surface antigen
MQRTWRRHVIALLAIILLQAATYVAAAEIERGTWEVGGYAAWTTYDNASTLDDSVTIGGRGAYFFRAAHGLELDIGIGDTDNNTRGVDAEFDLTKVFINYVHNFQMKRETRMMPLLRIGFGKLNVDDGDKDDSATTLQIGGGARFSLSPRLAMRFDGTLFRWRGDREVTPRDDFYSFEVAVGLSFLFGPGS